MKNRKEKQRKAKQHFKTFHSQTPRKRIMLWRPKKNLEELTAYESEQVLAELVATLKNEGLHIDQITAMLMDDPLARAIYDRVIRLTAEQSTIKQEPVLN